MRQCWETDTNTALVGEWWDVQFIQTEGETDDIVGKTDDIDSETASQHIQWDRLLKMRQHVYKDNGTDCHHTVEQLAMEQA